MAYMLLIASVMAPCEKESSDEREHSPQGH